MLTIILCVGVSQKIQTVIRLALTIVSMARRIMLLPSSVVALISLSRFFIIRIGVLGTIRVSVLNQSRHKCPHVIAVMLEPSQLQL